MYAADRMTLLKVEASPSMLWNNLTSATHKMAFAHKDSVYYITSQAANRKEPPALEKLPLPEPLAPVTQAAFVHAEDGSVMLVVTTRTGFCVYDSSCFRLLLRKSLTDLGVSADAAPGHWTCGIACAADDATTYIGTSWGELVAIAGRLAGGDTPEVSVLEQRLRGHKAPVTAVAVDARVLASGDDDGSVIQWDRAAGKPLKVHEGAGLPVTSLLVRGDLIVAGYASGHIRIFRAAASAEASVLEVEVAAHARCITALDWHPSQYTFASVGEDCALNVWSLPEMAVSGVARLQLDMTARLKDTLPAGVQFARHAPRGTTPDIFVAPYDSHSLRAFIGL